MKAKILEKVFGSILGFFISEFDIKEMNNLKYQGTNLSLHQNCFFNFGIPFFVDSSQLSNISMEYDNETSTASILISEINAKISSQNFDKPNSIKTFSLQFHILKKILKFFKITIKLEKVSLNINSLPFEISSLALNSFEKIITIDISNLSIGTEENRILENFSFQLNFDENRILSTKIENLKFCFQNSEDFKNIISTIQLLAESRTFDTFVNKEKVPIFNSNENSDEELEKEINENILNKFESTNSSFNFSIQINLLIIEITQSQYSNIFENLLISANEFKIDTFSIKLNTFSMKFNQVLYFWKKDHEIHKAHKMEIHSIESNFLKQMNIVQPFMSTIEKVNGHVYLISEIEYSGSIDELFNILILFTRIIDLLMPLCPKVHQLIDFSLFSIRFDVGINLNFSFQLLLSSKNYQIIGSNVILLFSDFNEPVFSKMNFQIVVDDSIVNFLLSPSDFRFTEYELLSLTKILFSQSKKVLNLSPKKRKLKMSIVASDLILCNLVNGHKHNYLMLSFSDIVLNAIPVKKETKITFTLCPSLKLFNPKTSFWDFLVHSFSADFLIFYHPTKIHIDANVPSNLSINITPSMIENLLRLYPNQSLINKQSSPNKHFLNKSFLNKRIQNYKEQKKNLGKSQNENQLNSNTYGSETIHIYNGTNIQIPFTIIKEKKWNYTAVRASSQPAFKEIRRKNSKNVLDDEENIIKVPNADKDKRQNVYILQKNEKKLLQNTNINSYIEFPSLEMTLLINQLSEAHLISKDFAISTSLNPNGGKLIEIMPRFEIRNVTPNPIKLFIESTNNYHVISSYGRFPLQERQCVSKIAFSYASNNDLSSHDSYSKTDTNTTDIKPTKYDQLKWFYLSKLPDIYDIKNMSLSLSFKKQGLATHIIAKSLYLIRNHLPFQVICTFISKGRVSTVTADIDSKTTMDLCLHSHHLGIEFTVCVNPLGISRTIVTNQLPQNEVISYGNLAFCVRFFYSNNKKQFIFDLYSPVIIENRTNLPLYLSDNDNLFRLEDSNFPHDELSTEQNKWPTYSSINTYKSLSLSTQEDGPFVPLPQLSQNVNLDISKNIMYPAFIKCSRIDIYTTEFIIYPRLQIVNHLSYDLKFIYKGGEFNVESKSSQIVIKSNPNLTFSISALDFQKIDYFSFQNQISTVFRFANEDEQSNVHLTIDKNKNGLIIANFDEAHLPAPFVIVNNLHNYPIYAQQSEHFMPMRIPANSTSMFPFDSPFSEPSVMITVAGKSQLVPLHHEIRSTQFPFKIGSEKIFADLIILSRGVQALIIGYHPYTIEQRNITFNVLINTISISFFTENLEEFLLVTAKSMIYKMYKNSFNFTLESLQIDDQMSSNKSAVILKSSTINHVNSKNSENNAYIDNKVNRIPFVNAALTFDSNLLNTQSFKLLVQPFDIQFDPTFIHDLIAYLIQFSSIKELKKTLQIPNSVLCLQNFTIHPILTNVSCRYLPNRQIHIFNSNNESKTTSFLTKVFVQDRNCSVGFGSLVIDDVILRADALFDILKTHYNYFFNNAVCFLTSTAHTERPVVSLSRFQASAIASEFYKPCEIDFDQELIDFGNGKKLLNLTRIEVFPVLTGGLSMSLKYNNGHLIQLEQALDSSKFGKRISTQKFFIGNRVAYLTPELITVETLVKKQLLSGYKNAFEKIRFLEYYGTSGAIACLTDSVLYLYSLPNYKITQKVQISNVEEVARSRNKITIILKRYSKWKSYEPICIDFANEGIAQQLQLVIRNLLIKQNHPVI
ncbi:hypothetical protein TRFO_15841 [Tritrichomonas foetus]|uniref:Uncharacterized protein n=1 Tax=Tritrichomonas foetus TaxID=1144522 RepID=A0A1J4KS60_9EUKA|nr:hypothetical protein TRFO_15841 [Tritrichomonas foetus]|eukprot:OHT13938.1 hypothetical protein TRFO_15841 [Tritrichomonas foetus]